MKQHLIRACVCDIRARVGVGVGVCVWVGGCVREREKFGGSLMLVVSCVSMYFIDI